MLDFRFGGFMPPDKSELGSLRFGGRVPDKDLLRLKSVYVCIRYTPPWPIDFITDDKEIKNNQNIKCIIHYIKPLQKS